VGIITSVAQLDELRARLNTRGCREKALAAALERRADELAAALDGGEGGEGAPALDLASLPRSAFGNIYVSRHWHTSSMCLMPAVRRR
jgi:hypothetical protein